MFDLLLWNVETFLSAFPLKSDAVDCEDKLYKILNKVPEKVVELHLVFDE